MDSNADDGVPEQNWQQTIMCVKSYGQHPAQHEDTNLRVPDMTWICGYDRRQVAQGSGDLADMTEAVER